MEVFAQRSVATDTSIIHGRSFKYAAFISYRHADKAWGSWLHRSLESYRVPPHLVGTRGDHGVIPAKLGRVFRDREELSASHDLGEDIEQALVDSAALVVICSPLAATSRWVNEEILHYKRIGGFRRIYAIIVAGQPNASDGISECFPPALKFELDPHGNLSSDLAEPIAADARDEGDGKHNACLKLISGLLGVDYDQLRRRELENQRRRFRRFAAISSALLLLFAALSGIAVWSYIKSEIALASETEARSLADVQMREARRALARILQAKSREALGADDNDKALALAVEAVRLNRASGRDDLDAIAALQSAASLDQTIAIFVPRGSGYTTSSKFLNNSRNLGILRGGELQVWDVVNAKRLVRFGRAGSKGEEVTAYATAKGANRIAVIFTNATMRIFDETSLTEVGTGIILHAGAYRIAMADRGRMAVVADEAGNIYFVDVLSGTLLGSTKTGDTPLIALAIAPNGKLAVSMNSLGLIQIWDTAARKLSATAELTRGGGIGMGFVEVSPTGNTIVAVTDLGAALFKASGERIADFSNRGEVGNITFSPDGTELAVAAGNNVVVFSALTSTPARTLKGHSDIVDSIEIDSSGKIAMTTARDGTARIWNFQTGKTIKEFSNVATRVWTGSLSPDGKMASLSLRDDRTIVWSLAGALPSVSTVLSPKSVFSVAWHPGGAALLTSGGSDVLEVTDDVAAHPSKTLSDAGNEVKSAVWSKDGSQIIAAMASREIFRIDASSGAFLAKIASPDKNQPYVLALAADGQSIFSGTVGGVDLLSLTSGNAEARFVSFGDTYGLLAVSSDGKLLAGAGDTGEVTVWDVSSRTPVARLAGSGAAVTAISFSSDNHSLLSTDASGLGRIYAIGSTSPAVDLAGNFGSIIDADFSPDGMLVATAGKDGCLRLWDAHSGAEIERKILAGPARALAFSPTGDRIATVSDGQKLEVWLLSEQPMSNTPAGRPILLGALQGSESARLDEMIAWAELTLSKPLTATERAASSLPAINGAMIFDADPAPCDLMTSDPLDPQRRAPGVARIISGPMPISLCEAAIRADPSSLRLRHQLGRARAAAGDGSKATAETRDAAARGYPAAMLSLGLTVLGDEEAELDKRLEGLGWIKKAWAAGLPDAGYYLWGLYQFGFASVNKQTLVEINAPYALAVLEQASALGSAKASSCLAEAYQNGSYGFSANRSSELYYYALATRQLLVDGEFDGPERAIGFETSSALATLARKLVREGEGPAVAAIARKVSDWQPVSRIPSSIH